VASLEEIRNERLKKITLLKKKGINPYPISTKRNLAIKEALGNFSDLSKKNKTLSLVGRVMLLRRQGGLIFFQFNDGSGVIQGLLKKDEIKEEQFSLFSDTVDVGDFLELRGTLFLTKRGEKTLLISQWKMLSKSLRSLPEKWHGLSHVEERFRKRYLDLLMSPEVRERFVLRSRIVSEIRSYLDNEGFLEVETPALQPLYGGASAEPFVTYHNALDVELYLRISDELYLKRLLIGGFPKVYEIAKNFRNEGIDATHYPEFSMLEFYESYSDTNLQMVFVEKLFKALVKNLFKKNFIDYEGEKINFKSEFSVVSYYEVLKKYANMPNPENITRDELALKTKELGVVVQDGDTVVKILDNIFKKICRPKIIQPTFIVDYPVGAFPLTKKKEGSDTLVDMFQLIIGGIELVKAFSELNDPIEQRKRFLAQEKNKKAGDKDAQNLDEDFIEAMEYGMPPAGGVGIGIDRLTMLFTNMKNIKEVILFPTMRSKS